MGNVKPAGEKRKPGRPRKDSRIEEAAQAAKAERQARQIAGVVEPGSEQQSKIDWAVFHTEMFWSIARSVIKKKVDGDIEVMDNLDAVMNGPQGLLAQDAEALRAFLDKWSKRFDVASEWAPELGLISSIFVTGMVVSQIIDNRSGKVVDVGVTDAKL